MECNEKPIINFCCGKYFVWDHNDAIKLRKEFRICGSTVGSLPRKPWQNNEFSLPVILMPTEAYLCLSKEFAVLTEPNSKLYTGELKMAQEEIDSFNEARIKYEDDQIRIFKREKREKMKLYYGRKKIKKDVQQWYKQDEVMEVSSNIEEAGNVTALTSESEERDDKNDTNESTNNEITDEDRKYYKHSLRVHIPTKSHRKELLVDTSLDIPKTEKGRLQCLVFEDLWNKGYYVTSAEKFGGDFLVYSGDPMRFHSKFIVIVMGHNETITGQQIVVYGRLGSSVKKTVAFASIKDSVVYYTSLTWKK